MLSSPPFFGHKVGAHEQVKQCPSAPTVLCRPAHTCMYTHGSPSVCLLQGSLLGLCSSLCSFCFSMSSSELMFLAISSDSSSYSLHFNCDSWVYFVSWFKGASTECHPRFSCWNKIHLCPTNLSMGLWTWIPEFSLSAHHNFSWVMRSAIP